MSPVKSTPFFLRKEKDNTLFLLCYKRLRGTRWLSVKGIHISQSGSSIQHIQTVHTKSLLHSAQLYFEWFYRHYQQNPCCFPFCLCTPFLSLLAMAFPKISLSFPGTGWWCPILLRVRPNLNLRREILCLFIKNERTAGSKARCNATEKLAFSQEALWRTSEETHLGKASNPITPQDSTARCHGKSTSVDF